MHFVAEDILAEGTADNRLHRMLGQDMHLNTISVPAIVVTIRTLIKLENKQKWSPLDKTHLKMWGKMASSVITIMLVPL